MELKRELLSGGDAAVDPTDFRVRQLRSRTCCAAISTTRRSSSTSRSG